MATRFLATLRALVPIALAATVFAPAVVAQGDRYPNRPVRLLVPFPPGGSVDTVARVLAPRLTEALGQQVLVENRSGASGNIGTELAARATPDGYTLLVNTTPLVSNAHLYPKLGYDSLADFAPVSLLCSSQSVLAVHPRVQARNVQELLELARANPGKLNFATAGPATNPHIGGEFLAFLGKIDIVPVHYKGGGPALLSTVAGETEIVVSGISEVGPFATSGKVRALGVTGRKRSAAYPDFPTIAESGLADYEFTTWHAMLAPKGTPAAVVALLNERVRKTLATPETAAAFQKIGIDVIGSSPDELGTFMKAESAKWGHVIKERKLRAD